MKTVAGLFDNYSEAQAASQDLMNNGFDSSDISSAASNASGQFDNTTGAADRADAAAAEQNTMDGIGTGAVIGTAVGAGTMLAASAGLLLIPGVGPVLAAGPLVAALTGAGVGAAVGAAVGGMVGGLTSVGVPEEEAHLYAEGVRRGGTLLIVRADDDRANLAANVLSRHGAVDIEQRGAYYRETGYTRYDTNAPAYTRADVERDRAAYATRYGTSGMAGTTATGMAGTGGYASGHVPRAGADLMPGNNVPGIQTGGLNNDGSPDTRGITEKAADAVTGDRYDDKTGKRI